MSQLKLFLHKALSFGFILFILGFFLSPTPGNHEHIYLYFVLIPFIILLLTSYTDLAPYTKDRLFICTEIVLFYLAVTVLWGEWHQPMLLFPQLRKILSITVLLLTTRIVLQNYPRLQGAILLVVSLSACVVACLALMQFLPKHFDHLVRFKPQLGSIVGLGRYENPIRVGWTWGATALCTIWIFYSQGRLNYLWLFLVLPPQLALLAATLSRGPILGLLVGLSLVLILKRRAVFEKRNLIAALCFLALGIGGSMTTGLDHKIYSGLTRGKNNFSDEAAQGYSSRIPIWRESLKQTSHNIFWGRGFSEDNKKIPIDKEVFKTQKVSKTKMSSTPRKVSTLKKIFTHSHNFIIDVYRFGGLIGVTLVTLHLLYCLILSFRQGSPHDHKIWGVLLCYGITCLLTNGKYVLNNLSEFWFIYWLPISFIYALRNLALTTSQPERPQNLSLGQASSPYAVISSP